MIQKTIRPYDGNSFTPIEASEWLKELDDRTKSNKSDNNSIDEIAGPVKNVVSNILVFSDALKGKEYGTWDNPVQGVMTINETDKENGGWVEGVFRGDSIAFDGPEANLVKPMTKLPTKQGDYKYAVRWLGGRYELWVLVGENMIAGPTNLASGVVTDTTIALTWTKSSSGVMTEYRAYNNGTYLQTFSGDVASGTLTGLDPDTLYNLTIRAYDGTNESGDSNSVVETTLVSGTQTDGQLAQAGSLTQL